MTEPGSSTRLPRARPSRKGVDAGGILAFLDATARDGLELHSLLVWRNGAVVAEGHWAPYGPDRPHMLHSATKSWTATAVGLAIGEGRLALQDRVVGFFPDRLPAAVSDNLAAMTVEDLLTMRTGHRTGISGGEWRGLATSWVAAFLAEPVPDPPGRDFMYSSATSYMLSAIVTAVTGETVRDYLEPRLLRPLGMAPIRWDASPEGVSTGGNGLSCRPEDALKLGVLHLRDGMWDGRRILPEGWAAAATRNHVAEAWIGSFDAARFGARDDGAAERRDGYGYQWWMTRHGGYLASGNFGQQCVVLPEKGAVVAWTAALAMRERRHMAALWEHLYPALDAETTGADDAALSDRLGGLALPRPEGAARSSREEAIDGLAYRLQPNDEGMLEVAFRFSADTCLVTCRDGRGEHRVAVGLGRIAESETTVTVHRLHHGYQPDSMRVAAEGAWPEPDRFHMLWRFVEMAFADTVVCIVAGDTLRLERSVNTNAGPLRLPPLFGTAQVRNDTPPSAPLHGQP